jgi:succinate-semialdehyde dehydrogenase/glutarate-semialdehyde dehydrogenase
VRERLIGCSLELGGKNPMVILDDADIEAAAEVRVRASFFNAGQTCVATERIYVAEPLFEPFIQAFVAAPRRSGSATPDFEHDMGSLINHDQLKRVSAHVEDAQAKGATCCDRRPPAGGPGELFYEPTMLTGVTPEMDCYAEETFGPLSAFIRLPARMMRWRMPTTPIMASTRASGPPTMIADDGSRARSNVAP